MVLFLASGRSASPRCSRLFMWIRNGVRSLRGPSGIVESECYWWTNEFISKWVPNLGNARVIFFVSIPSLFSVWFKLVLMPLVMFFLLKDQEKKFWTYLTSCYKKKKNDENHRPEIEWSNLRIIFAVSLLRIVCRWRGDYIVFFSVSFEIRRIVGSASGGFFRLIPYLVRPRWRFLL